jgi:lysozyme family protein
MSRFEACLAHTLLEESGEVQTPGAPFKRGRYSYMNHPADPGGATMMGVTHRVYDAWRHSQGLPSRDVKMIEDDEIRAIYKAQYWDLVKGDELPAGVDLAVFDFGVNSGPVQAIRSLQRTLGVTIDGHLGVATLAAVSSADPKTLVDAYMDARVAFGRSLKNYLPFKNGWETRWTRIRAAALAMVQGVTPVVETVVAEPPAPRAVDPAPKPWGPWAKVSGYLTAGGAAIGSSFDKVWNWAGDVVHAVGDLTPLKSLLTEVGANSRAIIVSLLAAAGIKVAIGKLKGDQT